MNPFINQGTPRLSLVLRRVISGCNGIVNLRNSAQFLHPTPIIFSSQAATWHEACIHNGHASYSIASRSKNDGKSSVENATKGETSR